MEIVLIVQQMICILYMVLIINHIVQYIISNACNSFINSLQYEQNGNILIEHVMDGSYNELMLLFTLPSHTILTIDQTSNIVTPSQSIHVICVWIILVIRHVIKYSLTFH